MGNAASRRYQKWTLLMRKVVFFGAIFAKHRQDLGLAVHHGAWEEQHRVEPNIHTSISIS
jgi:hypothetical protein